MSKGLALWIAYIFSAVVLVVGIIMIVFGVKKASTEGTVVNVHDSCRAPNNKTKYCVITVKYNVNGKDYYTSLSRKLFYGKVGDKIKIDYSPDNPSKTGTNKGLLIAGGFFAALGVLGLIFTIAYHVSD
jgi:hypothetical protein